MVRLDPMQRSREFRRGRHPRNDRRTNNEARINALSGQMLTAYFLATQPEQTSYVETISALPEPTPDDLGRFVVVQPPGTNQTITYVGTLSSGDAVFWLEISGTTDFVAYSHVFTFATTSGMMVDADPGGNAVVTRLDADLIGVYNPETGAFLGAFTSTANSCNAVAGGSQTQTPAGITYLDPNTVFVSHRDCHKIVVWDDATNLIKSADFVVGSGVASAGTNDFNQPWGLDTDGESLFVADSGNDRIVKRSLTPPYPWEATIGSTGAGAGQLEAPRDVAIDQSGNVYVADTGNHRIQKFTPGGVLVWVVGGPGAGSGEAQFSSPGSLAFDPRGRLHVVDTGNHRVQVFDQEGNFLTRYGSGPGAGDEQLSSPSGIAFLANGLAIVIDRGNNRTSIWLEGPFSGPGGPGAPVPSLLNDLTDTSITSPAQGSFLRYLGGVWTDSVYKPTLSRNVRTGNIGNLRPGFCGTRDVACGASEDVTGGGFANTTSNARGPYISRPQGNGWRCGYCNQDDIDIDITCYAVCVSIN